MSKYVVGSSVDRIAQALYEGGVIAEQPKDIRRIIIDLEVGRAAMIYLEKFADTALIDVIVGGGLQIVGTDKP